MSHLSFEGQSELDYCLECCEKHGQTAKVLMREAIQRCEADGCDSEGVKEKVKGVVEELMGIENDSSSVKQNERVDAINNSARLLWKEIYAGGAELGHANKDKLKELKEKLEALTELVYQAREQEEPCPTCKIESTKKEEEPKKEKAIGEEVAEKRRKFIEMVRRESMPE